MIKYRIYPTLLEDMNKVLAWEEEASKPWNRGRNPEEIRIEMEQNLLNHINRVPFSSDAIDKGTAFNAIIDCINNNVSPSDKCPYSFHSDSEKNQIIVNFPATNIAEERTFVFDAGWCIQCARYFKDSLSQVFVKAPIETKYGSVELYGLIDELRDDVVYDIKATSSYRLGKYKDGWQKHLYPYCLTLMGREINYFEYTAFQLKEYNGIISGIRCPEKYKFNFEESKDALIKQSEALIEFIENNRNIITDKRIFNE